MKKKNFKTPGKSISRTKMGGIKGGLERSLTGGKGISFEGDPPVIPTPVQPAPIVKGRPKIFTTFMG